MSAVATLDGLPTRLGKYEILTSLASGGMARIYIARATGIGAFERHVVLKLILPERAHDQTAVQMFLDEARLAASLNHQNVAQVFEVGQDAGVHFLAMEYVHGQDLRALLAKAGSEGTRVPLELALTVVAGAAAGLHHAHERRTSDGVPMGIVHRDVSPSNLMIGYDGAVKLLDFGIAKATMRSVETQSGIIKGKFAYMSPEQCRGRDVDRRSDVFSLGILLYEVTTQHRCFRADSDFDTMHRIVTGDVVRPTRLVLGYPAELEAIVMKALAVDPAERYASAGELLEAIEGFAFEARMPLSAGALGRFMRDMFGDIAEPWLVPGRIDAGKPREHTISNTSASGNHGAAPMHLPPGSTALVHVPDAPGIRADVNEVASWSVQPYPVASAAATPAPQRYHPAATPPPELQDPYAAPAGPYAAPSAPYARPSVPSLVPGMRASAPGLPYAGEPAPLGYGTPVRPTPVPHGYEPGASGGFPVAPSAAGSSQPHFPMPAYPVGSSVIGPARPGTSETSYPRYEPAYGAPDATARPSRRGLYLGAAIAAIAAMVVVVMARRGPSPADGPPPATSAPATAVAMPQVVAPAPPVTPEPAPVKSTTDRPTTERPSTDKPPILRDEITVHVGSTPAGAEVSMAGKLLGTTPLDVHMKRATGVATLTVHRAKFADATAMIDLSGNFSRELTLTALPDEPVATAPAPRPPVRDTAKPPSPRRPASNAGAKKQCQPPGEYNPFDTTCGGNPCPPCS
ncbi:MAG TPA: protein kinase [Kofleriaceae bacterium]|nr:protein kinase [Kofleriaceae bacterium]